MAGIGTAHLREPGASLLRAEHLSVEYPIGGGRTLSAVAGISLDLARGQTLSLVGESGCGKSTLGLALVRLTPLAHGELHFDGTDLATMDQETLRQTRPRLGIIFQDPVGSLNPRHTVLDLVAEPLRTWRPHDKAQHRGLVVQMLEKVGLNAEAVLHKRPHELSGGQCQRVSIARALVLQPELLICDEPVSALDVSIQAQVLNLLADLKADLNLTVLFISHDLAVVRTVSDRVAVMYLGKLCEVADDLEGLYLHPAHPYTAMLIASVPRPEAGRRAPRISAVSEPPSPLDPPAGCRFHTRCPRAQARCTAEEPVLRELAAGRFAACHFPLIDGASA